MLHDLGNLSMKTMACSSSDDDDIDDIDDGGDGGDGDGDDICRSYIGMPTGMRYPLDGGLPRSTGWSVSMDSRFVVFLTWA